MQDHKLPEKQYWKDYAPLDAKVDAVELNDPATINGVMYLPGDYSVRIKGEYYGVKREAFLEHYRPLGDWKQPDTIDRMERLFQRIDDLIVNTARLAIAMERYGIVNNEDRF